MSVILDILGVLFLLVLVVGLYCYWCVTHYRKQLRLMQGEMMTEEGIFHTPSRITIVESEALGWTKNEALQTALRDLRALDFRQVGIYGIQELRGIHFVGLMHPAERLYASVFVDLQGRVWADIACQMIEGDELTVTNAFAGEELDPRPGTRKWINKEWTVSEMVEVIKSERGSGPFRLIEPTDFVAECERSYAAGMEWRNRHGGASTWDEFCRIAQTADAGLTEEELRAAHFTNVYTHGVLRLNAECVATFRDETDLSVREWEEMRDSCFAVHEYLPNSHLADFVADQIAELEDSHIEALRQSIDLERSAVENFNFFNETLPEHLRAVSVGVVDYPVAATIFAAPLPALSI